MKFLGLLSSILVASLFVLTPVSEGQGNKGKGKGKGSMALEIPEVEAKDIICFALYTVHDKTLKLTAQLYPIPEDAPRTVRLEVERDGAWVEVATTEAIERGWTAPFRVDDWDDSHREERLERVAGIQVLLRLAEVLEREEHLRTGGTRC